MKAFVRGALAGIVLQVTGAAYAADSAERLAAPACRQARDDFASQVRANLQKTDADGVYRFNNSFVPEAADKIEGVCGMTIGEIVRHNRDRLKQGLSPE